MGRNKRFVGLALVLTLLLQPLFFLANVKPTFAAPPQNFTNEILLTGLTEPTGIEFLPDGRMLVINRYGMIRIAQAGSTTLDSTPVVTLTNIDTDQGERGLVGLTKDPNFASNGYI